MLPMQIIPISHKITGNKKPIILKRIMVRQIKTIKIKPSCKNCITTPLCMFDMYSNAKKLMVKNQQNHTRLVH